MKGDSWIRTTDKKLYFCSYRLEGSANFVAYESRHHACLVPQSKVDMYLDLIKANTGLELESVFIIDDRDKCGEYSDDYELIKVSLSKSVQENT